MYVYNSYQIMRVQHRQYIVQLQLQSTLMYLSQQHCLLNLNPMDGSPLRKKARFSEHPQVFEYSSKSKRDNSADNDSMLLDLNEEEARQIRPTQNVNPVEQQNIFMDKQIEIDQLTSDLAEIQAYLNQQSRPIIPAPPVIHSQQKATNQSQPSSVPHASTPNKASSHDRFTFNIRPELINTGRETMNLEQEIRARSAIKEMDDEVSNNKKRERAIKQKQKEKQKQKDKQKEKDDLNKNKDGIEKGLQQKIQDQLKKNKRITLDTKELLNLISCQSDLQHEQRRIRDQRKNRITMDVFALSKFLQTAEQDNLEQQNQTHQNLTPVKTNIEKSTRKTNIFSAFKQRPQQAQVKLFVNSYLNDAPKRLNDKKNDNKALADLIAVQKSQLLKLDLKISDSKKRVQRLTHEKSALQHKLKGNRQELDKKRYLDDIQAIKGIQNKMMIKVLKLEMQDPKRQQGQTEKGCYGHFMWDGIFIKAKSKGPPQPIQLKIMVEKQARENQKNFAISTEQALKLLKKYHNKFHNNPQNPIPFLMCISSLRTAYSHLIRLDNDLYYLSLSFNLRDFEINSSTDILSFNLSAGSDRPLLIQLNMMQYMLDQSGNDWSAIAVYDAKKAGYYDFSDRVRSRSKQKQKQDINNNRTSLIFEAVLAVLQLGGIV